MLKLGFLEEMSSVREHTITEIPTGQNRNPPILVHCSTGVGRTGLAVLSDLLLYTLDHNQVEFSFSSTLKIITVPLQLILDKNLFLFVNTIIIIHKTCL